MRKIIILVTLICILTGCRKADDEIVLSDNTGFDSCTQEMSIGEQSGQNVQNDPNVECDDKDSQADMEAVQLCVHVCGAVKNPGVYFLDTGSRLIDAIELAGGFTDDADTDFVNLAAPVQDGIKLQIPMISETASEDVNQKFSSFEVAAQTDNGNGLVNINTASKEELKTLSGVGDGIAAKIIDYRSKNDNFSCIEDIMKVSGIKEKLFNKIKDYITV